MPLLIGTTLIALREVQCVLLQDVQRDDIECFFDGLRAKTIAVPYPLDGPGATSLHRDTNDHLPLTRGTRAAVLASIGRYQPPRKKPGIPPSSMRIPCEDHGHEAPYDSAHREKNRLPDLDNIIQLGGRAHSIAHSILRTVLPLSLHLFVYIA